MEVATLAGGCFWCLEAIFKELEGVAGIHSGYTGGHIPHPTYKQVCSGETNHAEAVQVTFDPNSISCRDLLRIFFTIHDPTTVNRQGADVGSQYRSAIFYHDEKQLAEAEQVIAEISKSGLWSDPLVTEVTKLGEFYQAEDYHQDYFANNPNQPYCMAVVAPKVVKFRKQFTDKLKK